MKKLISVPILCAAIIAATTGCGGNGSEPANLFAGPKFFGFYDADSSNSSWGGACEVIVRPNGSFEPNGVLYTSTMGSGTSEASHGQIVKALGESKKPIQIAGGGGGGDYESHEGTITNGSVSNDGTVHFEAKVTLDSTNWPSMPLADPYIIVTDGRVDRRGFGWEGSGTVRYYDLNADGSRGALRKEIPYDLSVHHGPS